jgi:hypothetical protein
VSGAAPFMGQDDGRWAVRGRRLVGGSGASRHQFWESKGNRSRREGCWATTISGGGEEDAT